MPFGSGHNWGVVARCPLVGGGACWSHPRQVNRLTRAGFGRSSGPVKDFNCSCDPVLPGWTMFVLVAAAGTCVADWPQYRGANHDGQYHAAIRSDWESSPPVEVWRVPLDPGLSSSVVAGGRVFTQVRRSVADQAAELCVALDAATGLELWATSLGPAQYPNGGVGSDDGPRSTPAVVGDAVFILTSYLKLWCLDAGTGRERWSHDLRAEYGAVVIPWQNAASAIVEGDRVIVNGNAPGQCMLAFHTADGSLAWKGENDGMTQATPVMATIAGTRQVIFFAQTGLVGVSPDTGDVLWRHRLNYNGTSVAASPVVAGDRIYASRAYPASLSAARAGATVIQLRQEQGAWSAEQVWYRTNQLMNHWCTPVILGEHIYGHFGQSTLTFKCIELATGTEKWSEPGFGYGSVLVADDDLLVVSESGELVVVASNPESYTERARFRALDGKCWNAPAISDGRIYLRSTLEAVCLDVAAAAPVPLVLRAEPAGDGSGLRVTVAAADGSSIDAGRAAGIEVQASPDPFPAAETWMPVTTGVVLADGRLELIDPDFVTLPRRYFRALELP